MTLGCALGSASHNLEWTFVEKKEKNAETSYAVIMKLFSEESAGRQFLNKYIFRCSWLLVKDKCFALRE